MIYSKQREVILKTLYACGTHPTADDIYQMLKPQHPSLSLATVYRNLNQLAQNGMAMKIEVPDGSDRFDGTLTPHHHMICEQCGSVTDIPAEYVSEANEWALNGLGVKVNRCSMIFYGLCAGCNAARLN